MKNDIDKLIDGEEIYRHEDLKEEADKWSLVADSLQYVSLGLLVVSMFILNALPKEAAKAVVIYWAVFMFILATVAFFVSRKALNYRIVYLNSERTRISSLFDQSIAKVKKGKK